MIDNQVKVLTAILRYTDIQKYSGDSFWKIIKMVTLGELTVVSLEQAGMDLDMTDGVKNLALQMPAALFWDKMKRYMFGTFKNFREQVRMAEKFNPDNNSYEQFVKRQMYLIDEMNDDKKIDYFAQLTRCFLLKGVEEDLFYKLASFLVQCTPEELDYIERFNYEELTELTALVSSLYQIGLYEKKEKENGGVDYGLSDFAIALKLNCLNYAEGTRGRERIISYKQMSPLILEKATYFDEISDMFTRD